MPLAPREQSALTLALDPGSALGTDARLALLEKLRSPGPEAVRAIDQACLERIRIQQEALVEAATTQERLEALHKELTAPPWYSATFLGMVETDGDDRAMVQTGHATRCAVGVADEIDVDGLKSGDEVLLSHHQNRILAMAPIRSRCGQTALFDRILSDGTWALTWHDGAITVTPSARVSRTPEKGERVQFDEDLRMAFSIIEDTADHAYFVKELPDLPREALGGQDENLAALISAMMTCLHPQAAAFELGERNSIILYGPPGTGKGLLVRIAASELARANGKAFRFASVRPCEWESPWVGETQAAIRRFFEAVARAARESYVVIFLDEVDAVGPSRRSRMATAHHEAKFLAALLAELDGFSRMQNVCVVAATNCKDHLDPALLERLNAVELHVARPDASGARAIFDIHLPATLPFSPNGASTETTRATLIEMAVARLYSGADNKLCTMHFRDGNSRDVFARELMSGRVIEQMCRSVRRYACERAIRDGGGGIGEIDMARAVDDTLERLRGTLTAQNVHAFLPELDRDVDVVRVAPASRHVKARHAYFVHDSEDA